MPLNSILVSEKPDTKSDIPIYKQISQVIITAISDGRLSEGEKLPSENELVEMFGASRITVRAAIKDLIKSHKLISKQGKGTFVANETQHLQLNDSIGFTQMCELQNKHPKTKLVSKQVCSVPSEIKEFFPDEDEVFVIKRLRTVDGQPLELEIDYFSKNIKEIWNEDDSAFESSLYNLLSNKYEISKMTGTRITGACLPDQDIISLLEIGPSEPLLCISDIHYQNDKLVYDSKQYYNTKYIKFISSFNVVFR